MNPEIKKEWVAELRSGKYHQVVGALHDGNGNRCALGILVDVFIKYHPGKARWSTNYGQAVLLCDDGTGAMVPSGGATLPIAVRNWAGLNSSSPVFKRSHDKRGEKVMTMNDTQRLPFNKIADRIEFGQEV